MTRLARTMVLAAAAVLLLTPAGASASIRIASRGSVLRVLAADRLELLLRSGERVRVRLLGVDAELPGACLANEAAARVERLAAGRDVVIFGDPSQPARLENGDLLAYVRLPDGLDLGRQLLLGGQARVAPYQTPFERLRGYRLAETAAKDSRRGFWSRCADLALAMDVAPDRVTQGNEVGYTLTATSDAAGPTIRATLTDELPVGTTLVSTRGAERCTGTTTIACDVLLTRPEGSGLRATGRVVIVVRTGAPGVLTNRASVSGAAPDLDPANNAAEAATTVVAGSAAADLSVAVTPGTSHVFAGETAPYTVTVKNNGPAEAIRPVLTGGPVTPTAATASPSFCAYSSGGLPCVLQAGQSVTVNTAFESDTPGTYTTNLSVASDTSDPLSTNDSGQQTVTVAAANPAATADLTLTMTAAPSSVRVGHRLVYTFAVQNSGPSEAVGVALDTHLPVGLALESATASQGSCDATIVCRLGVLRAGASATVTVAVRPGVRQIVSVSGEVSAQTVDPTPVSLDGRSNAASVLVGVVPAAAGGLVLEGDSKIGDFAVSPDATVADATSVLGWVGTRRYGEFCDVAAPDVGLTLTFQARLGEDPCTSGRFREAVISTKSGSVPWRTERGLRIGDKVRKLRRIYPSARAHGRYWWLIRRPSPYDASERFPGLSARVVDGRVVGFVIFSRAGRLL